MPVNPMLAVAPRLTPENVTDLGFSPLGGDLNAID